MPRFRLLVAALACACLMAPAAAAFGVALHLEWAEHHGEHHHSHDPAPPAAHHEAPAPAAVHLDHAPHTHGMPTLESEPAVSRERDARAIGHVAGAGGVTVCVPKGASPGDRLSRLRAFQRPDTSSSSPDLVHLHCTLLI